MDAYVAIFVVITVASAVAGNPYERPVESSSRASNVRPGDQCMADMEHHVCIQILIGAFNHSDNGLKEAFTHYCSEIQGFVPCVEENRNDALELLNCSRSIPGMTIMNMLGNFLSIGEQLDMVTEFFNAVNNIFCNRIDEVYNLVKCIEREDRRFQPIMNRCVAEHVMPLMSYGMNPDVMPDISTTCTVMYGFTSCLKDGMVGLCGDVYFDLLETTYEEVIVDVIGDAIDCNEEHEPLLDFVRSLQEKFRR